VGPDAAAFTAEFPGPARSLEIWDALDGSIRKVVDSAVRTEIRLAPRESVFVVAGGRTKGAHSDARVGSAVKTDQEIKTDWVLDFDGPDAPPPARLGALVSWTELPGGCFYSGAGIYRARFQWDGILPARAVLAFDEIRDAAEVRLNGRPLGILFTPRLEIEAAAALRIGPNDLEIVVVNRPLNRSLDFPTGTSGRFGPALGTGSGLPRRKKSPAGQRRQD